MATVTPARVAADAEAIGRLQGRLRAVHLAAHLLETPDLLTLDQVARYDALRGYAGGDAVPGPAAPGGAGAHRH